MSICRVDRLAFALPQSAAANSIGLGDIGTALIALSNYADLLSPAFMFPSVRQPPPWYTRPSLSAIGCRH